MRRLLSCATALAVVLAPLGARADAAGELLAAAKNFSTLSSWHADETFGSRTIGVDYAAPDRFRLAMPTGDQYVIGNDMYIIVGGHTMKMAMPQVAMMVAQLRSPATAVKFAQTHAIKDLGASNVGGVPAHAYAFDDTTDGFATHDVIDIGPNHLPARMTVKSDRGTAVIRYSKFNAPMTITRPA